MVVQAERLLGINPLEPLFAERGKGGKERKKPKKKKTRKKKKSLGWLDRIRQLPSLPRKRPEKEPGRITDFVRAHRKPKRGK